MRRTVNTLKSLKTHLNDRQNHIWVTCKLIKDYLFHQSMASSHVSTATLLAQKNQRNTYLPPKIGVLYSQIVLDSMRIHTSRVRVISQISEVVICGPRLSDFGNTLDTACVYTFYFFFPSLLTIPNAAYLLICFPITDMCNN